MKNGLLGLLALLVACSCSENKKAEQKSPTRVKTQMVSPAFADGSQTYVGIIEEREATAVSFTGMGVVRRMLVSEGQAVSRGQLLAEMDDTQARNLLSGAEAQMTQANDALQRYQMLHDNGSLPEVQWVEIQSKVAQARSQLEVAKKNLIKVPVYKGTIPHEQTAKFGGSRIIMQPATPGTGVKAGGAMRAVLESVGVTDVICKSKGSSNPHNLVKATFKALAELRSPMTIAHYRGVTLDKVFNG